MCIYIYIIKLVYYIVYHYTHISLPTDFSCDCRLSVIKTHATKDGPHMGGQVFPALGSREDRNHVECAGFFSPCWCKKLELDRHVLILISKIMTSHFKMYGDGLYIQKCTYENLEIYQNEVGIQEYITTMRYDYFFPTILHGMRFKQTHGWQNTIQTNFSTMVTRCLLKSLIPESSTLW